MGTLPALCWNKMCIRDRLVPEIWIAFAEASGIPELKKTTRDEPDYDKLMKWRLGVLKEHGLGSVSYTHLDVYKRQCSYNMWSGVCGQIVSVRILCKTDLSYPGC